MSEDPIPGAGQRFSGSGEAPEAGRKGAGDRPRFLLARRLRKIFTATNISLVVALCSVLTSAYQSWNYSRSIDSVQRNVLRAENLRTCRDIIDVFFQFRLKAEDANARLADASRPTDLRTLAYHFGALSTFLANFREDDVRGLYAKLSWDMLRVAKEAETLSPDEFASLFASIDETFTTLNDDCAKSAQRRLL